MVAPRFFPNFFRWLGLSQCHSDQTRQLGWWKDRLGRTPLGSLGASAIVEARDALRLRPLSAASVNRHLAALSVVLNTARTEWSWMQHAPMDSVKFLRGEVARTRYLDDPIGPDGTSELTRFLAACEVSESPLLPPMFC